MELFHVPARLPRQCCKDYVGFLWEKVVVCLSQNANASTIISKTSIIYNFTSSDLDAYSFIEISCVEILMRIRH
jgi:hypothetical protein